MLRIITKGEPEETLEYSPSEIETLTYQDLDKERVRILNIKTSEYFQDFIQILSFTFFSFAINLKEP
jgi:hypothetical protein